MGQAQDGQRGVLGFGLALGGRQVDVAEAVGAMNVGRIHRRVHQRFGGTGEHRHVFTPGHFTQFQRIADRVVQADIAGGNGEADHVMAFVGKGHQQGQGVIDTRIGVDQQRNLLGHACRLYLAATECLTRR